MAITNENDLYKFVLNRLFNQGENELRQTIGAQLDSFVFTEKQKYFINRFTEGLQHAYYVCKDIDNKNILWEVGKGIALTAGVAGGTKLITSFFTDNATVSNITAITSGILTGLYSAVNIKSEVEARVKAKNALLFFETKGSEGSPDFAVMLACEFALEFRLAIEMLVKSDKGIDIVVDYFIEKILKTVFEIPTTQLKKFAQSEKTEIEEKLNYIKLKLIDGNIPATNLTNQGYPTTDLNWNLKEFLQHAPIIVCMPIQRQDTYRFTVYLNSAATKMRGLKQRISFGLSGSVSAEASHKYPPRLMYSREQVIRTSGYTRNLDNRSEMPIHDSSIPDILDFENTNSQANKDYSIIAFYKAIRQFVRNDNTEDNQKNALNAYLMMSDKMYSKRCNTNIEWFNLFMELQMLRNIYWNVLVPHFVGKKVTKEIHDLFQQAKLRYEKTSSLYTDEDKVSKILIAKNRAKLFFHDQVDKIPTVEETKKVYGDRIDTLKKMIATL